jgi:hypothetical protein
VVVKKDENKEGFENLDNIALVQLESHEAPKPAVDPKVKTPGKTVGKHAILMTGATHARELISTTLNIYELLQLLQKGEV